MQTTRLIRCDVTKNPVGTDARMIGEPRASPSLGEIGDRKALQFHLLTAPFFRTGQGTS